MVRHYCTYFDHHYFPQGMAMMESLRKVQPEARFTVLGLSAECLELLAKQGWPELKIVTTGELENTWPELAAARQNRSRLEYYFTCTPFLLRFCLSKVTPGDLATYLDADLGFFRDPEPLFAELGGGSVGIIPHRFPRDLAENVRYGKYNVGWVTFRQDISGQACLEWWAAQCAAWCYDRIEPGRFGDQKYLDEFEERFSEVRILEHPGANLAPWCLRSHQLGVAEGSLVVDGKPLLFFHFHGFKFPLRWAVALPFRLYGAPYSRVLRKHVVEPWLKWLAPWEKRGAAPSPLDREGADAPANTRPANTWKGLVKQVRSGTFHVRGFRAVIVKVLKNFGVGQLPPPPPKEKPKKQPKPPKPEPPPPPAPAPADHLKFTGDFLTWEEASAQTRGYDSETIFETTRAAMRKIVSGEAVYERDSVLMAVPEYPFSTIAGLLPAAANRQGRLAVMDFGGALGSTYFACRPWLDPLLDLRWSVVEQAHYVEAGRQEFSTERLAFHPDPAASVAWHPPDIILASGALHFLPDPMAMLQTLCAANAPWLLVERTPFWEGQRHRIAVQHVPAEIYEADYACWLFCETLFLDQISPAYELVTSWPSLDVIPLEGGQSYFKGMLFLRRQPSDSSLAPPAG
jgi:putative methyltransferase (TIGR04325 family)